ncbi:unnamed protein product [Rotaria sp. Silwood2]|nr:unnamed protein product [Rotaria sp. Silwood2]CAF3031976.1 unnamed protein product [Rotaria sp. Silwood2]CAF3366239.1 unnamed protein product [Rotaria sp. Silwood2]CAF4186339.1 unnamed protein product [Rotaria sp. Silwood2]CAF4192245.1 unnamed protein product [Rotaria sp. Silwood2]
MPFKTLLLDTSVLPNDALSFYDDAFYQMVEKIAGLTEAKLLEVQGIRSVYSFLNTEDVFDILSIPCSVLKDIKTLVYLEADDNTLIVKPGFRSSIQYLYQLLHQKHEEHMEEIAPKAKRNKQKNTQKNIITSIDVHQDPLQTVSTLHTHQQSMETAG